MRQRSDRLTESRLNVLVLADYDPGNAAVVSDFLYSFDRYSKHAYFYRFHTHQLTAEFDLDRFDVILVFWSIWIAPPEGVPSSIPADAAERIRDSRALKVVFLQDEYRAVRPVNRALADLGTNLMFTCVAEDQHDVFYPSSEIPSLRGVRTVLTGYVPDYLKQSRFKQKLRPLTDIGYRSRQVPYALGHIGQEKTEIATRFQGIAARYGFSANISVREADRIYGRYWFDFLRSTRFQLGTPSGASVIDFDGSRWSLVKRFQQKHPLVSYKDVHERFLADLEGKHAIDTVSPRFFEYAATMNTMVLHEGHYTGILRADEHFIEVKKDYSNVDDVVARMRDDAFCAQLRKTSYDDLIASGRFSYAQFVSDFDKAIEQEAGASSSPPLSAFDFYREQYDSAGQYVAVGRGKELVLPIGKGLTYWRRRLTDKAIGALPVIGQAIKRRGGRPTVKFAKGMATLRAAMKRKPILRALLHCMFFPREGVSRYGLLREFALLSIIDQMQRDTTPLPKYFVIPTIDKNAGVLRLQTHNRQVFPNRLMRWRRSEMANVSALLDAPGVDEFQWHLPRFVTGMWLNGEGQTWFQQESGGVFYFREIPRLLRTHPDLIRPMLIDVLKFENVHRSFRRSLPNLLRSAHGSASNARDMLLTWKRKQRSFAQALEPFAAAIPALRTDGRTVLSLFGCIVRCPPLARYVTHLLLHRRHLNTRSIWTGELKLMTVLVRCLHFGVQSPDQFHIVASVSDRALRLTSRKAAPESDRLDLPRDQGRQERESIPLAPNLIVWDHSAVAPYLRWQTPSRPVYQSPVGEQGVLRLVGLEHFAKHKPARAFALIETIAQFEPSDPALDPDHNAQSGDSRPDSVTHMDHEVALKRASRQKSAWASGSRRATVEQSATNDTSFAPEFVATRRPLMLPKES